MGDLGLSFEWVSTLTREAFSRGELLESRTLDPCGPCWRVTDVVLFS